MLSDSRYIFVEGNGSMHTPIRPHNWAERFAGHLASYSLDRRLRYSNALEPLLVDGTKWLRICRTLEASHPALLGDILGFADHYGLRVHGLNRGDVELTTVSTGRNQYAKAS